MKKALGLLAAAVLLAGIGAAWWFFAEEPSELFAETQEEEPAYANRLVKVQETGALTVCTSPDYAPYEFLNGEAVAGADIALAGDIAEGLGAELQLVTADFDACLEMMKSGAADLMVAGMLPTASRKSYLDFTDVYHTDGAQRLIIRSEDAGEFSSLDTLAGKTVAAQYGTLQAQLVAEQLPESYLELADTQEDAVRLLKSGTADAVALSEVPAKKLLADEKKLALMKAGLEYTPTELVAGVPRGEEELLAAVNEIIGEAAASGRYFEWLDAAYQEAAAVQKSSR